ncbi:MAG: hypothetical protein ACK5MV_12945 [Aminipila sp.]
MKKKVGIALVISLILLMSLNFYIRNTLNYREDPHFTTAFPAEGEVPDDMISDEEKNKIDEFYNIAPSLVSVGEIFYLKYCWYNEYNQEESSEIQLVFKGETYINIDKVEIDYSILWYGQEWKNVTVVENSPKIYTNVISENNYYRFAQFNISNWMGDKGTINFPEDSRDEKCKIGIDTNSECQEKVYSSEDNTTYNLQNIKLRIYYHNEMEEYTLSSNEIEEFDLYKLDFDLVQQVQEYDDKSKLESKQNDIFMYYHSLYQVDKEQYYLETLNLIKAINESSNKEKLLKEIRWYEIFLDVAINDIDDEVTKDFIFHAIEDMYANKEFNDKEKNITIYSILSIINENGGYFDKDNFLRYDPEQNDEFTINELYQKYAKNIQ